MIKDYRLILVLEKYNCSIDDIDKILAINAETEDQTAKDRAVRDSIELFFMIEEEKELIESLKCSGQFQSLMK